MKPEGASYYVVRAKGGDALVLLVSRTIEMAEVPEALSTWVANPGATSKVMVRIA